MLITITFLILLLANADITYAKESTENKKITVKTQEYTEEYEKWLSLSEEHRENYIEPDPYGTPYYTSKSGKMYALGLSGIGKTIAPSYDLRNNISMSVKNQMQTGSCWAFATTSVLESNINLRTKKTSPFFSARHIEYATSRTFLDGINKNGYDREVNSGGNSFYSFSYLTSAIRSST